MRQHPIPQNILDIEFKLFTKFTVREFVYMTTGIGFGGIFLYFFTKGQLPALIAIPIFAVSSAIGLFFGLVPINDQKADVFLKNYIAAITSPTRRVWRGKDMTPEMNDKMVKGEIDMTIGTMDKEKAQTNPTPEIIGSDLDLPKFQFVEKELIDGLDQEEKDRLAQLDANLNGLASTGATTQVRTTQLQPQTQSQTSQASTPTITSATSPSVTNLSNATPKIIPRITIDSTNIARFSDQSYGESGNILVLGSNGQPLKEAVVVFKDQLGRVIIAQKTNDLGYTTVTKKLPNGMYGLTIAGPNTKFPEIQLEIKDSLPSIKIAAI